ncbi:MAG TPA: RDD family protein [Methylibium sp.]
MGRRMAAFVYEAIMLFGVSLVPGVLATLIHRFLGDTRSSLLLGQACAFLTYGVYFVWLWTKNGQTLPMQTWKIRLVTAEGSPLSWQRAALRYLACWIWIAPAAGLALLAGWSKWSALLAVLVWMLLYAASALLQAQRQFWHDILCGTRLVDWQPPAKK